jgi:hypothetical protein
VVHWQQGFGQRYLASLTEPGGDRGRPSKEGCATATWHKRRRALPFLTSLYVVKLEVYRCWRAVWNSHESRHVPEVRDVRVLCQLSEVETVSVKVTLPCTTQNTPFVWNRGPHGGWKINAQADLENCLLFFGCLGIRWHEDMTIRVFGNGTWQKG